MNKGYADIWLERDSFVTEMTRYSYLIELKYIKADEMKTNASAVKSAYDKAKEKLEQYMQDKKIQSTKENELKKIIIILSSGKLERMEALI